MSMMLLYMISVMFFQDIDESGIPMVPGAAKFDEGFETKKEFYLEASERESVLGQIKRVSYNDKFVMVACDGMQAPVKVYSAVTGEFFGNLGRIGQGPGEYNRVDDVSIYKESLVILSNLDRATFFYDRSLNFVFKKSIEELSNGKFDTCSRLWSSGSTLVFNNCYKASDGKVYGSFVWEEEFKTSIHQAEQMKETMSLIGGGSAILNDLAFAVTPFHNALTVKDIEDGTTKEYQYGLATWPIVRRSELEGLKDKELQEYLMTHLGPNTLNVLEDKVVLDYGAFLITVDTHDWTFKAYKWKYPYGVVGNANNTLVYFEEQDSDVGSLVNPKIIAVGLK